MDEKLLSKLLYCTLYTPYYEYVDNIVDSNFTINRDFGHFFNYKDLSKLNVCVYNYLEIYVDENGYFNTSETLRFQLKSMIDYFVLNNIDKKKIKNYLRNLLNYKKTFPNIFYKNKLINNKNNNNFLSGC